MLIFSPLKGSTVDTYRILLSGPKINHKFPVPMVTVLGIPRSDNPASIQFSPQDIQFPKGQTT